MRNTITAILILAAFLPAFGQKDRNVVRKVGVGELIYTPAQEKKNSAGNVIKDIASVLLAGQTSHQEPQYAEAVRASVVNGLSRVRLLSPFDGQFQAAELESDMPALYADGTINNISTIKKTETSGKNVNTYYRGLVSVTVNLKDARDGTVVNSHTFNITDSDLSWIGSTEKAMSNALEYLSSKIEKYYNSAFPLYASIVEGGNVKKDKQKEVYIDLGEPDGVYKGMQFDVFVVKTIAGKEAKTMIGRLKIEEVEGDEISLCKVTKGGDRIKPALEEGQTLLITSR